MDIRIDGKQVLITGGTGSLGVALVEAFTQSGGLVYFQYHSNDERAQYLEKSFGAKPVKLDFYQDNLDTFDCNFDILVNNAGVNLTKRLSQDISINEWNKTLLINVTIPYQMTQKNLSYMLKKQWGRIINISSIYGLRVTTKNLPYNVSKHGLSGLTKTIAKEYVSYGITCNEICPGPIDSEMMDRIAKQKEFETGVSKEEYFRTISESIPAGRFAKPMEIAYLALYLASDYAEFINGVSIPIDGGFIA